MEGNQKMTEQELNETKFNEAHTLAIKCIDEIEAHENELLDLKGQLLDLNEQKNHIEQAKLSEIYSENDDLGKPKFSSDRVRLCELNKRLESAMDFFELTNKVSGLQNKINHLSVRIDGIKRAFSLVKKAFDFETAKMSRGL